MNKWNMGFLYCSPSLNLVSKKLNKWNMGFILFTITRPCVEEDEQVEHGFYTVRPSLDLVLKKLNKWNMGFILFAHH